MPATLKEFETVFPRLVEDLKEHCRTYKLPDQALNWFDKVHTTLFLTLSDRQLTPSNSLWPCSPSTTILSAENATAASPSSTPPNSSSTAN